MLRSKRAETDASRSDGGALFPVVALLAAAAAIEYLVPGGGERPRVSSSAGSRAAEDEDGRGRLATTPSEIPPRGWKDILLRVYSNVSQHRILALAAGMTYYSLCHLPRSRSAGCSVRAIRGPVGDSEAPRSGLRISPRRRHRCRPGPAHARCLEGVAEPRAYISDWTCHLALERQRGDEVVVRHAEHRLWRGGKARVLQAERGLARLHGRRDPVRARRAGRHRRHSRRAQLHRAFRGG